MTNGTEKRKRSPRLTGDGELPIDEHDVTQEPSREKRKRSPRLADGGEPAPDLTEQEFEALHRSSPAAGWNLIGAVPEAQRDVAPEPNREKGQQSPHLTDVSEPATNERVISAKASPKDEDSNIRPRLLRDIIGQEQIIDSLKIAVDAAKGRHEPLGHLLFYGPPGLGKTTLSHVMANEMGVNIRITAGPSIERAGDLAAILTHLRANDILFIDEIHRLGRAVEEIMYPAMEDFALDIVTGKGPGAKNLRLSLPKFTVIGATTRLALLSGPLRTRFDRIYRLDFYTLEAMTQIVTRGARVMKIEIDTEGAIEIGRRGRGTPRIALRLLKSVRDYAQVRAGGKITEQVASEALDLAGVDPLGLDDIDRRMLRAIIENFDGGPVGLDTIAASISEEADTIMDVYEPYLLQLGFLERKPRGRVATRKAYEHLHIPYTNGNLRQANLFDDLTPTATDNSE